MICPRCSVAEIIPATGACSLCGFVPDGSVAVEAPHPDATDHLARLELAHEFRIDVLLGQGKHSAVYLVREGRSSAYMVLKVLPRPQDRDDPQADERFRRAIETTITLDHPHVVRVHRYGTTDSLFWYTMDHVRARSLREVLRSRGPLELKTCQRLVSQIASALDYMHRRGLVHGALKPENVLIDPNGWVHVCDPLVTHAIERPAPVKRPDAPPKRDPTATRQPPAGKVDDDDYEDDDEAERPAAPPPRRPDYIAPEDHQGMQRQAASDQYALGVLVHECLAGTLPSAGSDAFEPVASLQTIRPDLPPHVTYAVRRAMSLKPADRYPSVLDFVMAIETGVMPLTDSRPSGRASEVLLIAGWKPPLADRRRWLLPVIVLAVIAGTVTALWSPFNRWRSTRSAAQDFSYVPRSPRPYSTPSPAADSAAPATVAPRHDTVATLRRPTRDSTARPRAEPRTRPSTTTSPAAARTTRPAPAATAEPGKLFVNASPWGQVFVDGTLVGNTPKANLAVAAGSHTIRVVRDGYETWERTVQVGAGESVRLTDIVLTARP
jgi:serine/threonine protein kinase